MVAMLGNQMFAPLCRQIVHHAVNGSLPPWIIGLWPNLFQAGVLALLLAAALGWRHAHTPHNPSNGTPEPAP